MNLQRSPLFYLGLLLVSFGLSFTLFHIGCFSAICVDKYLSNINLQIILIAAYLFLVAAYLITYDYLPNRTKAYLAQEAQPFKSFRKRFKLDNRHFPNVRVIDFIHVLFLVLYVSMMVTIWYIARSNGPSHGSGPTTPQKKWAGTMGHVSGHLPDILLALTLFPVSRNAFFAKRLGLSPAVSIRYHQLVGNMFVLGLLIHFGFAINAWTYRTDNMWRYMWNMDSVRPFSQWTIGDWEYPTGVTALIFVLSIRLFSLPIVRRRAYEVFLASHLLLPIPMVILASFHARTPYIFAFPALALYLFDLIFRAIEYFTSSQAKITVLPGDIVRLEVKGSLERDDTKSRSGIFFDINIKRIDKVFAHPFSVARITNDDTLVFYIDGAGAWTKSLIASVKSNKSLQDSLKDTKDDLKDEIQELVPVSLHGPYGSRLFNMDRIDAVACFVAGIGLTGISQLLFECMELHPDKKVYLFWSIRNADLLNLPLFKELVDANKNNAKIQVNFTGNGNAQTGAFDLVQGRLNFVDAMAGVMDETLEDKVVGVYTCAPEDFMIQVESATSNYPSRIIFEREVFTW